MKIGIVTLPLHTNYGGIIQAWALQQTLAVLGHDAKLICQQPKYRLSILEKSYKYPYRAFKKFILRHDIPIRPEHYRYQNYLISLENDKQIRKFISDNINIHYHKNITKIDSSEYDAIVIGSDQIWRQRYCLAFHPEVRNSFGWFARKWNKPIISYAASFGIDNLSEFSERDKKYISLMMKRFKGISVREKHGVSLCMDLGARALHVLDPTLLMQSSDYKNLIPKDLSKQGG